MIPVFQTRFGNPGGNCFQACIASVLEMPLEQVPDFCNIEPTDDWFDRLVRWLQPRGATAVFVQYGEWFTDTDRVAGLYSVVGGPSPRGKGLHSVVYYGKQLTHDPLPGGGGWDGEPRDVIIIVPLDPKRALQ